MPQNNEGGCGLFIILVSVAVALYMIGLRADKDHERIDTLEKQVKILTTQKP